MTLSSRPLLSNGLIASKANPGWSTIGFASLLIATVHYMVEAGGFFGIDLSKYLPYNLTRTWHLQAAIFFVSEWLLVFATGISLVLLWLDLRDALEKSGTDAEPVAEIAPAE